MVIESTDMLFIAITMSGNLPPVSATGVGIMEKRRDEKIRIVPVLSQTQIIWGDDEDTG